MLLKYKGLLFDEWEEETDDDGNKYYWSEMCDKHGEQYKELLIDELSDGGMGCCSLKDCDKIGADEDDAEVWYYVDFKTELVEFIK